MTTNTEALKMMMDNQCNTVEALTKISEAQNAISENLNSMAGAMKAINDNNILHLQLTKDISTQVNFTKQFSTKMLDILKWVVVATVGTVLMVLAKSNGLDISHLLPKF